MTDTHTATRPMWAMRRLLSIPVLVLPLLLLLAVVESRPSDSFMAERVVPGSAAGEDPAPLELVNCADTDAVPCVAAGDVWLVVTSWSPLSAVDVALCPTEDGGPSPCVWAAHLQGERRSAVPLYLAYGVR